MWSDLVRDDARVAVVKAGSGQVHFFDISVLRAGCPTAGPSCATPAYVVPGDVVLTGHAEGRFTCAGFHSGRGSPTIRFLPTAALATIAAAGQAPQDWAGRWSAPEQDIVIRAAADGALTVAGDASWGMGDPWRRQHGAVHTGEVKGTARPVNGVLAFTQGETRTLPFGAGDPYDCRVRMIRRGPYLLVRDNANCGGENVSFTGFYRRRR